MKINLWIIKLTVVMCTYQIFPLGAVTTTQLIIQKAGTIGSEGGCLTTKEITRLKKKAAKGSREAARRISDHYGFCKYHRELFLYWMERSAKLGNADAIAFVKNRAKNKTK